jgi:DNA replication protein DnaC
MIAKECTCRKERILRNRLRFANIPDAFKDMTLKNFRTDVYKLQKSKEDINIVIGIISTYLKELEVQKQDGMGLYIYSGTRGSGKTRLAASLANEFMQKHNMQVKFAVTTTILNEIKATWYRQKQARQDQESSYTESELLDALVATEVLIMDDLGVEMSGDTIKDWINDRFYTIIDGRYRNKKITIFTSNYALSELKHDTRITNRIKERVYEIPFPEESVREYIAEKNNADMLKKLKEE